MELTISRVERYSFWSPCSLHLFKTTTDNNTDHLPERPASCPYPGLVAEVLLALSKASGIRIRFNSDERVFHFKQLQQELLDNMTDVLPVPATATQERRRLFQVSDNVPAFRTHLYAMSSMGSPLRSIWTSIGQLMSVYNTAVWILIILCMLLLRFSVLQSESNRRFLRRYSRVSIVHLSFFLSVFGALYQGLLLAKVLNSKSEPLFTDLESLLELVERKQVRLIAARGTMLFSEGPKFGVYKRFDNAINANPVLFEDEIAGYGTVDFDQNLADKLDSRQYVSVELYDLVALSFVQQFCSLRLTQLTEFGQTDDRFLFSKAVPVHVVTAFNTALLTQQETLMGIKQRYVRFLKRKKTTCSVKPQEAVPQIKLVNFLGAFVLLGFGATVGLVSMALEWTHILTGGECFGVDTYTDRC